MKPDLYDAATMMGLILVGIGLWMVYPPLTPTVIGLALIVFGINGAITKSKRGGGSG